MRNYEWATIEYEGDKFDVCIDTRAEEVDEIRAVDSEIDLIKVMDLKTIKWFEARAIEEINAESAAADAETDRVLSSIPLGFTLKSQKEYA